MDMITFAAAMARMKGSGGSGQYLDDKINAVGNLVNYSPEPNESVELHGLTISRENGTRIRLAGTYDSEYLNVKINNNLQAMDFEEHDIDSLTNPLQMENGHYYAIMLRTISMSENFSVHNFGVQVYECSNGTITVSNLFEDRSTPDLRQSGLLRYTYSSNGNPIHICFGGLHPSSETPCEAVFECTIKDLSAYGNSFRQVFMSGQNATIDMSSDTQYICGTLEELTLFLPFCGVSDVIFTSGTTPTVLYEMTGGQTEWPSWFDPAHLEANKIYEINFVTTYNAINDAPYAIATVAMWDAS